MAFFEWTDSLSVKIPSIDRQHKLLIDHINTVAEKAEKGVSPELMTSIDKLVKYTKVHFSYEENIFNLYKFPGKDQHLSNHEDLFEKIASFEARLLNGKVSTSELMSFLRKWLENHIMKEDRQYSAFLDGKVK